MGLYNGRPLFYLDIEEEINGLSAVSLVDCPAIERDFIALSKEKEVKFSVNDEKRIVFGPALIPEQKIYRRDSDGNVYYVSMTKDAIERIAQKFFKDGNQANGNLQHKVDVDGLVYFESYLINHDRGVCPVEFSDLPDGTWMLSCKVYNDEVWELVKDGTLRGFSIQGSLHVEKKKEKEIETLEELLDYLNK